MSQLMAEPVCYARNCKHFRAFKEEADPLVDGVTIIGGGTVICLAYPDGIPDRIAGPYPDLTGPYPDLAGRIRIANESFRRELGVLEAGLMRELERRVRIILTL